MLQTRTYSVHTAHTHRSKKKKKLLRMWAIVLHSFALSLYLCEMYELPSYVFVFYHAIATSCRSKIIYKCVRLQTIDIFSVLKKKKIVLAKTYFICVRSFSFFSFRACTKKMHRTIFMWLLLFIKEKKNIIRQIFVQKFKDKR